jgi:predicted MFS family arabinose efflux permease
MKSQRIAVLLATALVLGVPLGAASHSHPGITNVFWVASPFALLVALVAAVIVREDRNNKESQRDMQYVFIFVMAYAALAIGNLIGLLI